MADASADKTLQALLQDTIDHLGRIADQLEVAATRPNKPDRLRHLGTTFTLASVFVSACALGTSLWVARTASQATEAQLVSHFMEAQFGGDRMIVGNPELWSIYDQTLARKVDCDSVSRRKAFIFYYFNLFDEVYFHYNHENSPYASREEWHAWVGTMRSFLLRSEEARAVFHNEVFSEPQRDREYSPDFVDYIERIIKEAGPPPKLLTCVPEPARTAKPPRSSAK